ncbi:MAG: tRNA(Met) cytidine acetyltransferase TmcA [Plesiomonas sp.]
MIPNAVISDMPDTAYPQWLQQSVAETARLHLAGHRRLLVISGSVDWVDRQSLLIQQQLRGDWLKMPEQVAFRSAQTLLGQEFQHAVFDARAGFDVQALAIVAGTLTSGSWLVLLLPRWAEWAATPDSDSLRWSEQTSPIATPHFVAHCQRVFAQSSVFCWCEEHEREQHVADVLLNATPFTAAPFTERQTTDSQPTGIQSANTQPTAISLPSISWLTAWSQSNTSACTKLSVQWLPPDGTPTTEQRDVLQRLLTTTSGVLSLTAARGRGKSAVAGMLAANWSGSGKVWVTAPKRASVDTLFLYATEHAEFYAPDALLAHCQQQGRSQIFAQTDWLLVDEAAAIPAPLLQALLPFFPRILLLTTVQGYEGTGRGFELKFCAGLSQQGYHWQALRLQQPMRWAAGDPLEQTIADLLLLEAEHEINLAATALGDRPAALPDLIEYNRCITADFRQQPERLKRFYALLTSAHYRTTPLDLRRLLDVPDNHSLLAECQVVDKTGSVSTPTLLGGVWLINEGGLSAELAQAIWRGERRPRGNLLVQSLAAHADLPQACQLNSVRISRIAVAPDYRRQGLAAKLVDQVVEHAAASGLDFVSVSFGFTPDLWLFWQHCGFALARIGTQKEASSGCYAAMALKACSEQGAQLCLQAQADLARRWPLIAASDWMDFPTNAHLPSALSAQPDWPLSPADLRELEGFAYAHRALETSWPSLCRLLKASTAALPHLHSGVFLPEYPLKGQLSPPCVEKTVSHKAWLQASRREVAAVLESGELKSVCIE